MAPLAQVPRQTAQVHGQPAQVPRQSPDSVALNRLTINKLE